MTNQIYMKNDKIVITQKLNYFNFEQKKILFTFMTSN